MNLFLQTLGLDVWKVVLNGYNPPKRDPPTGTTERRLFECNSRAMSVILGGLASLEYYAYFSMMIYLPMVKLS